jgi:hypothetical protein
MLVVAITRRASQQIEHLDMARPVSEHFDLLTERFGKSREIGDFHWKDRSGHVLSSTRRSLKKVSVVAGFRLRHRTSADDLSKAGLASLAGRRRLGELQTVTPL